MRFQRIKDKDEFFSKKDCSKRLLNQKEYLSLHPANE